MSEREKVIKRIKDALSGNDAKIAQVYGVTVEAFKYLALRDALAMLKEDCHNCKLECLLQKYDELKEKYDALLKEKEETELCDRCGRRRMKSNRIAEDR